MNERVLDYICVIYFRPVTMYMISDTTNNIRKIINRIFAMPAAAPAIPVNPSTAAIIAITIKRTTQDNIDIVTLLIKRLILINNSSYLGIYLKTARYILFCFQKGLKY